MTKNKVKDEHTMELTVKERDSFSLTAQVSTTVQSILSLDYSAREFKAMLELDFKYPLGEFVSTFPGFIDVEKKQNKSDESRRKIKAEDITMPYILTNAVEITIHREVHFFRKLANEGDSASMYADPSTVVQEVPTGGNLNMYLKCEKYVMTLSATFHSIVRHQPFDQIYLFVKIATDGRPGTENTRFVFDEDDSSFGGFQKSLSSYKPVDPRPVVSQIDIGQGYSLSGAVYPRVYLSMRYQSVPWENLINFYVIPCATFVLLVIDRINGADLLGLSATLILANIALLFVSSNDNTMSYQEQAVIINTMMLVGATMFLRVLDSSTNILGLDLSSTEFTTVGIALMCVNISVNIVIACLHRFLARREQRLVHELVTADDFNATAKKLAVL